MSIHSEEGGGLNDTIIRARGTSTPHNEGDRVNGARRTGLDISGFLNDQRLLQDANITGTAGVGDFRGRRVEEGAEGNQSARNANETIITIEVEEGEVETQNTDSSFSGFINEQESSQDANINDRSNAGIEDSGEYSGGRRVEGGAEGNQSVGNVARGHSNTINQRPDQQTQTSNSRSGGTGNSGEYQAGRNGGGRPRSNASGNEMRGGENKTG